MRVLYPLIVGVLALGWPASAQTTEPRKLDMIHTMIFEGLKTDPAKDRGGTLNQVYGIAGREDLIVESGTPVCAAIAGDPIAAIVEQARKTQIVIINEHHASPRDRAFIAQVLDALKPEGFDIYAAETFSPYVDLTRPGVRGEDGVYLNESIFARTLAHAKSIGFLPVGYEIRPRQDEELKVAHPDASQINRREIAQTENLMQAIFRDTPGAKAVIHVGHAHVWERRDPAMSGTAVWMAERLKAASGHDPLTIDQTVCKSGEGRTIAANGTMGDNGFRPSATVDMLVGHPPLEFRGGRVAWRQDQGERTVPAPDPFGSLDVDVVIEARPADASLGMVPSDRLLLRTGEALPLLLPPGRYRVDGYTASGRIDVAPVIVEVQ